MNQSLTFLSKGHSSGKLLLLCKKVLRKKIVEKMADTLHEFLTTKSAFPPFFSLNNRLMNSSQKVVKIKRFQRL